MKWIVEHNCKYFITNDCYPRGQIISGKLSVNYNVRILALNIENTWNVVGAESSTTCDGGPRRGVKQAQHARESIFRVQVRIKIKY